jgi:hypothetical protein
LPYYDPAARRYEVARAKLGTVDVTPGKAKIPTATATKTSAGAPRDPFEGLSGTRKRLGPVPPPSMHRMDTPAFWAVLLGGPVAMLTLRGLWLVGAATRRRLSVRAGSRGAFARKALLEARQAAVARNAAQVAFAVERAVYATIEDRLGLKARAILRDQLAATLTRCGVDAGLAKDVTGILDASDTLRFTSSSEASPEALVERATDIVARLARTRPLVPEQAA